MTESVKNKTLRLNEIICLLEKHYPDTACFLNHKNPYELLVATRLSAQTTDLQVNKVTPALFERYPTVHRMAEAKPQQVEELIKSVGLYKTKARDIIQCCQMIIDRYNGEVPNIVDELIKLPGVGRKTAAVVLGNAFNIPAIAVDTHFGRIMRRLGFTSHTDPEKVEAEMTAIVPPAKQVEFCHRIISHGRNICKAKNPNCSICFLHDLCKKII